MLSLSQHYYQKQEPHLYRISAISGFQSTSKLSSDDYKQPLHLVEVTGSLSCKATEIFTVQMFTQKLNSLRCRGLPENKYAWVEFSISLPLKFIQFPLHCTWTSLTSFSRLTKNIDFGFEQVRTWRSKNFWPLSTEVRKFYHYALGSICFKNII